MSIFESTVYWGIIISIGFYVLCSSIQKKKQIIFLNPLLISTLFTIVFLLINKISYKEYYDRVDFLHYLLSPATVCLAIPLYEQVNILRKHIKAIFLGILSGVIASMTSILIFSIIFSFSHTIYITLLPKSITAAIAMSVSEEWGGISSLTVPIVIMTGITGHVVAGRVCKMFKITEPIAKGVAIGSSSHAMGTAKAMEIGKIEGAMSSLSVAIAGIITVASIFIFAHIY